MARERTLRPAGQTAQSDSGSWLVAASARYLPTAHAVHLKEPAQSTWRPGGTQVHVSESCRRQGFKKH